MDKRAAKELSGAAYSDPAFAQLSVSVAHQQMDDPVLAGALVFAYCLGVAAGMRAAERTVTFIVRDDDGVRGG